MSSLRFSQGRLLMPRVQRRISVLGMGVLATTIVIPSLLSGQAPGASSAAKDLRECLTTRDMRHNMSNNYWNYQQQNDNYPPENNQAPQSGSLLRDYHQQHGRSWVDRRGEDVEWGPLWQPHSGHGEGSPASSSHSPSPDPPTQGPPSYSPIPPSAPLPPQQGWPAPQSWPSHHHTQDGQGW